MNSIRKLGVLVANEKCNANCSFCAGRQHRTNNPFDYELFEKILIDNKTIEELSISGGGEPLMHPDKILKTLEITNNYNIKKIKLYTNGILLKSSIDFLIKCKNMGLTHLYVTVHNIDPNKSKLTLNTNFLPPTMLEIKEIEKLTGLNIRINIPLFNGGISTLDDLNKALNTLKRFGLNNVSYWVIRDNNDKRDKNLGSIFNLLEPKYDETKQTLFPNGELRFDWCN